MTVDEYGLASIGKRWTPRSMTKGEGAEEFMSVVVESTADSLNPLLMIERYAPIILSPSRCNDADVVRVLRLNGIEITRSITNDQARRLAILGSDLRAWRGSFRSLRSVIQALTGSAVVIRSWLVQRVIVDESSWDLVVLDPDQHSNETDVFLVGSGPDAVFDRSQVAVYVDDLSKTILDTINYIPCYVVTSWRDGLANWTSTGLPSLVPSAVPTELECIEIGPLVDASSIQFIGSSTRNDIGESSQTLRCTVFVETSGANDDDYWEIYMCATEDAYEVSGTGDAYVFRVHVGINRDIESYRLEGGTLSLIGAHEFNLQNGTDWRRIDVTVIKSAGTTKVRMHVDGNSSYVFEDTDPVGDRPDGPITYVGLRTSQFSSGKLRISSILAQQIEV